MKKRLLSLLLLGCTCLGLSAQNIFSKDNQVVNATIGFGHGIPLEASYEYAVADNLFGDPNCSLGVGGYLGWNHYNQTRDFLKHKNNSFRFGTKVAMHYYFVENLDTYAGFMLGYRFRNEKWHGTSINHSYMSFDFLLGARYYFTQNWAVVGEFGFEASYFRIGAAYRF